MCFPRQNLSESVDFFFINIFSEFQRCRPYNVDVDLGVDGLSTRAQCIRGKAEQEFTLVFPDSVAQRLPVPNIERMTKLLK